MSGSTLLVTGASGHLGRRVIELLLEAQAGPIIAATRTPEKLSDFSAKGVTVRQASFDNPASLATAFAGVDRLLLISTDATSVPGFRLNQHVTAVKAAQAAGVQHIIYTSIVNPGPETPVLLAPDHYGTEAALTESTMGWTSLRNNLYADMLPGSLSRAIEIGQHYSAAGDGKTAYVTREDCARTAAAALASDFTGRRALDVTGPQALSQADLVALASKISGKSVTYVPISAEAAVAGMVGAGLPESAAELYVSFDTAIAQGIFQDVSNTVEELSGKKPIAVESLLASELAAV
ncbi:MAG: SDR family oxidoreductase [Anaerolineae bacterium]